MGWNFFALTCAAMRLKRAGYCWRGVSVVEWGKRRGERRSNGKGKKGKKGGRRGERKRDPFAIDSRAGKSLKASQTCGTR
jgi:hypothetical protein